MEHFRILYHFVTSCLGISFLVVSLYLLKRGEDSKLKYFVYFYSSFTMIAVFEFFAVYVKTNCFTEYTKLYEIIRYLSNPVGLLLIIYTFPLFVNSLIYIKSPKNQNILFGILAIILLITNYSISLFSSEESTNYIRIITKDSIFIMVIFYVLIKLFIHSKKAEVKDKTFFTKTVWLFALFIPGIIIDTFFTSFPQIKIFPVIYVITGVFFVKYYFDGFEKGKNTGAVQFTEISYHELEKQYGLTSRESETLKYIVMGYSNKKIADELFISINTVKSHIRNSYQKLEISNRIELINLLNSISQK